MFSIRCWRAAMTRSRAGAGAARTTGAADGAPMVAGAFVRAGGVTAGAGCTPAAAGGRAARVIAGGRKTNVGLGRSLFGMAASPLSGV